MTFTRNIFIICVKLCYNEAMKKALLIFLAISSLLPIYGDDLTEIELIIVNKTLRGFYSAVNEWDEKGNPEIPNWSWCDIGLSRNGKEPIEYIWRAVKDANSFAIMNAEIGDKGTIYLRDLSKEGRFKLLLPNAENPPVVGMLREVYWRKAEPVLEERGDFILRFPFVETDTPEIFLYKYQGKDKNVIIPSYFNITDIDRHAFTKSGVVSVTIPNGVKRIRREAFSYCGDITTIILPSSLKIIDSLAFMSCESLKNIVLPAFVVSIGEQAFIGCKNLTTLVIPSSVTSLKGSAFDNCDNLTEIVVDDNNLAYSSIGGVLFNKDKTILMKYPEGKHEQAYFIPASVSIIESGAFNNCKTMTSIIIPNGVTAIDIGTFYGCSSLRNVAIPLTVTKIDMVAFAFCYSLTEIIIPENVTTIGDNAFLRCENLSSVTLPRKTQVGKDAFPDTARIIYVD